MASLFKPTPVLQAPAAAFKFSQAQRCEDELYKPRSQDYFTLAPGEIWKPASTTQPTSRASKPHINPKTIRLISWNIDMLVPFGYERMSAALQHIESLITSTPSDIAIIIFLQEMTSADLSLITASPWVKARFHVTDKDNSNWLSPHYGTTTLIDARLNIASVFRVPWNSKFSRDGLFVDIALSSTNASIAVSTTGDLRVLRLCNVHLESLVADPPVRPSQLSAAAKYLHAPEVTCALLAGDLNAIEPFDRHLHSDNNLKDAYLELGGKEDSEEGYTWGYQVPAAMKEQFGCSRMDKILFRGDVRVRALEKIGVGVKVADDKREEVRMAGKEEWVSDHYGVMGDFEFSGEWMMRTKDSDK